MKEFEDTLTDNTVIKGSAKDCTNFPDNIVKLNLHQQILYTYQDWRPWCWTFRSPSENPDPWGWGCRMFSDWRLHKGPSELVNITYFSSFISNLEFLVNSANVAGEGLPTDPPNFNPLKFEKLDRSVEELHEDVQSWDEGVIPLKH